MPQVRKQYLSLLAMFAVLVVCLSAGCGPGDAVSTDETSPEVASDDGHSHGNGGHGPHDGDVIELGNEKYHAELVHSTGDVVTVYILGSQVKNPMAIDAAIVTIQLNLDGEYMQFQLPAKPLDGEEGKASRFELSSAELVAALKNPVSKGRLNVQDGELDLTGDIEHHTH